MIDHLIDRLKNKIPSGYKRSSKWKRVREEHLKNFPKCAVCEGTSNLEVHHKKPFHIAPELELDSSNLITLCESKSYGITCHLLIGHLGSYKSFNPNVVEDASVWNSKLKSRKKLGECEMNKEKDLINLNEVAGNSSDKPVEISEDKKE